MTRITRMTDSPARSRGLDLARPTLTPRGRVDPMPRCPSHAPIEPTDLARPRPRATQLFFVVRSAIFDKA
jgi:hypothetical protein